MTISTRFFGIQDEVVNPSSFIAQSMQMLNHVLPIKLDKDNNLAAIKNFDFFLIGMKVGVFYILVLIFFLIEMKVIVLYISFDLKKKWIGKLEFFLLVLIHKYWIESYITC